MKINTNIQALNAYRNLSSNQFHTSKNLERLSSGLRINRAADDAAGLAISEKMRAQIRGLKMAERNSMDGISMIQTAEGALTEVHAMLQRMRELAVQAANDTNTETDRKEIQKEINQLTSEINRIGNATEFNTKKLLNGGATKIAPNVDKEGMAISTGKLVVNEIVASQLDPATPGEYTITVEEMFTRGEKVTVAGVTLTAVSGGADPIKGEFNVGNTKEEQAHNIQRAITNHLDLNDRFDANVTNNVISLTEKVGQISGEPLTVVNTGNATGTVFFDHQVKSVEAAAPVWETGEINALTNGQSGRFLFNGVTITINAGDNLTTEIDGVTATSATVNIKTDVDPAVNQLAQIITALNQVREVEGSPINNFSFVPNNDEDGIVITGFTTNPGSLNELRVHTTGDISTVNSANSDSQLVNRGITATSAKYVFDITSTFKENETISFGGFTFKGVEGTANPTNQEFNVNGNAANQAESLMAAIAANPTLSDRYNITLSGSKITLEEIVPGSEKATGVGALTHPTTALTNAIPGEFSFNIERSVVGQSFTIDGQEIRVVNDSVSFNDDVNNGTAMRYHENLALQAENLREAINRNPFLNERYIVEGTGETITLRQRPGQESSELPKVMLGNTGTGDTFRTQLQIGPNQSQTLTFELNDMRAPELGLSTTDPRSVIRDNNGDIIQGAAWNVIKDVSNGISESSVEYSLDITSHEKASAAISVIDSAIERVNAQRASLGAFQNRLEHTINNLQVTHENLTASESRIRDADMALEMTEFTRNNIINQAATAMLAQANQLPQGVLQLLQ